MRHKELGILANESTNYSIFLLIENGKCHLSGIIMKMHNIILSHQGFVFKISFLRIINSSNIFFTANDTCCYC